MSLAGRFNAVIDRFLPSSIVDGSLDLTRRARLSVTAAWVSALIFLMTAAGQVAANNRTAAAVDASCGLLNLLAPFLVRRTGRVVLVTHGVLAVIFCAVIGLSLLVRGAGLSGATLMLSLIPLFATLIVGGRAGGVWAVITLLAGVALGALGQAGLISDHIPASARLLNDHLVLTAFTLVLFAVAALFEVRKEEALRQISALETQRRMAELGELKAHTEAQLAEADRFASLGRIAAATAHEINNPLSFIIGNVELLAENAAARRDADDQESLRDVLDGARRIQRIVGDLRARARPRQDASSSVLVHDAIAGAIKLAEPHIVPRARVRMIEESVPPVAGDEARLEQVFLNLLVNAAEAIPEGRADDHEIVVEIRAKEDRVTVEVRDTGLGLAERMQGDTTEKESFFTPRRVGEGTGLGLALSEAVVRSLGGSLVLESEPGKTVARVTLLARPATEPVPLPRPASAPPRGRRRRAHGPADRRRAAGGQRPRPAARAARGDGGPQRPASPGTPRRWRELRPHLLRPDDARADGDGRLRSPAGLGPAAQRAHRVHDRRHLHRARRPLPRHGVERLPGEALRSPPGAGDRRRAGTAARARPAREPRLSRARDGRGVTGGSRRPRARRPRARGRSWR
jgi:signal transduction histidine kinase